MFPLAELVPMIIMHLGMLLGSPIFWLLCLLIFFQYRKISRMKSQNFQLPPEPLWKNTAFSILQGILGGVLGSFIMVLVGISLTGINILYLWIVAILLLLLNPRFLCFAYAGGLISLSYLTLGFPEVNVAQLMGLVAVLHMIESLLILTGGHRGAVPVYARAAGGRVVGAYTLQKFWPIPIVALILVPASEVSLAGLVTMPEWWPLIESPPLNDIPGHYMLLPVLAGLGYGDLTMTTRPEIKARRSAAMLALYSFLLLFLAIVASRYEWLAIFPALFAPVAHEFIIRLGKKQELQGKPLYVPPAQGVMVLDVVESSPAAGAGIASGDIILRFNGWPLNSQAELTALLEQVEVAELEFLQGVRKVFRREVVKPGPDNFLGIIPVPEADDLPQVRFS